MKKFLLTFGILVLLFMKVSAQVGDPTSLTVQATGTNTMDLTWVEVTASPAADGYIIYAIQTGVGAFPAAVVTPAEDLNIADGVAAHKVTTTTNNYNGFTGFLEGTSYTFRLYSYKGGNISDNFIETTAFTWSTAPSAAVTLSATLNAGDGNRIDLGFPALNTLTNADGYLLYRKAGSAPVITALNNGAIPPASLDGGNTVLVTTITNPTDVAFPDDNLTGGTTYHYTIIPFNYNGSNPGTYNFLKAGAPAASATTLLAITIAEIEGGGSNIAAGPLGAGTQDQAILGFSITTDGPTQLNTLSIPLTSAPTGKISNARLFFSNNSSFGGDASINTGTLAASQIDFTTINYAVSAGTYNFFVVVDIENGVSAVTAPMQPSMSETVIAFSAGTETAFAFSGINYSFADVTKPVAVAPFQPADGSTGVSVSLTQIVITFSEKINNIGTGADSNNNIRIENATDGNTHETINPTIAGKVVISGAMNNIATITLTTPLVPGKNFAINIGQSVFADDAGNKYDGITNNTTWNFITESAPSISSFTNINNAGTTTSSCINDVVTINGSGFGTVTKPTITINGTFIVAAADIQLPLSDNLIRFTLRSGATSGTITVRNNDNGLTSAASASSLTVLPAITTGLSVAFTPASPAQGNSVTVNVDDATSQTNLTYELFLDVLDDDGTKTPDGIGTSRDADTKGSGSVDLNAGTLSSTGIYHYFINAGRAECTTREVSVFTINISPLAAEATANKTTVCAGETVTLNGSAMGGTGFNSFQWYNGVTLIGTGPSITVTPAGPSTQYTLRATNNSGGTDEDLITITVNPVPNARFRNSIRSVFSDQDSVYRVSDSISVSPAGGIISMSGLAVSKYGDGKYYFDPKAAGIQNDLPIYLNYTINNCTGSDTLLVDVNGANVIIGLENEYCSNRTLSNTLTANSTYINNSSYTYWNGIENITVTYEYTFKRLGFYSCDTGLEADGPGNPLQPNGNPGEYVLNVQQLLSRGFLNNCFYIMIVAETKITERNSANVIIGTPYTYEGWINYQYFQISYLRQLPVITSIKDGQFICSDGNPITLETDLTNYTTLNFTINDGGVNSISYDAGTKVYTFDPDKIPFTAGTDVLKTFTLNYIYKDDNFAPAGGCQNTVSRTFQVVPKLPAPVAEDETYCQFYEDKTILTATDFKATDVILTWFDAVSLVKTGEGPIFNSEIDTQTPGSKTYQVRQVYFGCAGIPDEAKVTITPAPDPNVVFPSGCEDRETVFNGPTDNVTNWEWDLGVDGVTATTKDVSYTYDNPGFYNITLKVTSIDQGQVCSSTIKQTITIGENPVASLDYRFLCNGDFTEFTGGSTSGTVTDFLWNFGDTYTLPKTSGNTVIGGAYTHGGRTNGNFKAPRHRFDLAGDFEVTLVAYTSLGCYDTLRKTITVLEYLPPFTSASPYLMENEEGGMGFWRVEDVNDSSTWIYGLPNKTFMKPAEEGWVTSLTSTYKPGDRSFVNSPCLDIDGITKPVLSMDYIVNTPITTEGATLEFSINNGVTWIPVGSPGEGSNWFNTTGFNIGNIGSSPVGWSGSESEPNGEYLTGKRSLDTNIPQLNLPNARKKVRFRIAFASDASRQFEGFAFRNFSITERNRTMLIENFTNETDTDYGNYNTFYKGISSLETAKIQYHVGYPEHDNNSALNVTDPAARAAYYGVALTDGLIPRLYIDGINPGSFNQPLLAAKRYDERSLINAPFKIDITATDVSTGSLKIVADITVLENFIGNPVLHFAVVEKTEGLNEYILRKMLPNAAGTQLAKVYAAQNTFSVTEEYMLTDANIDGGDLAVVVFIQDELTREVYQAQLQSTTATPIVTSVEDPTFAKRIILYPNPANAEVTVLLPAESTDSFVVKMIDPFGRIQDQGVINRGQRSKTISTSALAQGVYFLELQSPSGSIRKKFIVVHE